MSIEKNIYFYKGTALKLHTHFHCAYNLKYHLVLVVKYRHKCLTEDLLKLAETTCKRICDNWDFDMIEFGGESDHVHILFSAYPSADLSVFINNIKTVSSRMIRKEHSEYLSLFFSKPTLWSRGYYLLSVGDVDLQKTKKFIQNQGKKNTYPSTAKPL